MESKAMREDTPDTSTSGLNLFIARHLLTEEQKKEFEELKVRMADRARKFGLNTEELKDPSPVHHRMITQLSILNVEQTSIVHQLTNYLKHSELDLEELEKRYDRLKRFGISCDVNQWKPTNPSAESEIKKDTLHVYGVDYMNTQDVKDYFKGYTITDVKWLNDSSCTCSFYFRQCKI